MYVDAMKPDPKKGELNRDFGLYVERPFFIVSQLGKHRYLDMIGHKLVIKIPNNRKTQQFWFDQKTKTIKSMNNKNWSFTIESSGGSRVIRMWHARAQWF